MTEPPVYLLDVNVLIARVFGMHEYHASAVEWFETPGLRWALCAWTEAGFLRYATAPGRLSMGEASGVLDDLAQMPGYHYHTTTQNWRALTMPFFNRLHGHNQVTGAFLLGMVIHCHGMRLATFDKRILHVAREFRTCVHVVGEK